MQEKGVGSGCVARRGMLWYDKGKRPDGQKGQISFARLGRGKGGQEAVPQRARGVIGGFLALEGILYLWFLTVDIRGGGSSTPIKYAAILLCLAFALWACLAWGGERLVCLALGLTVWADWYLLVQEDHYLLGVMLFCGVQLCYLVRILRNNGGQGRWGVRGGLAVGALVLLAAAGRWSGLDALAVVYISFFACNMGQSLTLPGRRMRLFALGLVLFFCCDVWVGVFNVPDLVPGNLYAAARVGMWLCYLPAQVLIVLSALPGAWFGGRGDENK